MKTKIPTTQELAEACYSPTGIGWVSVEKFEEGKYRHVSTFRSNEAAEDFIKKEKQ